jgi:hypothetical protein
MVGIFHSQAFTIAEGSNVISDHALYHWCKGGAFWDKQVWIIPIHRPQQKHWTLAVVSHFDQRILFYDSFGTYRQQDMRRESDVRFFASFAYLF